MIEIEGMTRRYGTAVAVDNLTLRIEKGDAFAFIGPNGAGKTTTIKILATLLEPDSGTVRVDGISVTEEPERIREILGYMPDQFGVYDGMRVWEYLEFFAAAFRKGRSERRRLVQDVLELTDLEPRRHDFVSTLSMGLKQRLCLAKTLIHDPRVLILDEPASGLDPRARIEFRELMKELMAMGKTLFVSSHILPELADFCTKVGIIEGGRLLEFGAVDEVVDRVRGMSARCVDVRVLDDGPRLHEFLGAHALVTRVRSQGDSSHVQADFQGGLEDLALLLDALVAERFRVVSFHELETDLEDVFMKITQGGVGEGGGAE